MSIKMETFLSHVWNKGNLGSNLFQFHNQKLFHLSFRKVTSQVGHTQGLYIYVISALETAKSVISKVEGIPQANPHSVLRSSV